MLFEAENLSSTAAAVGASLPTGVAWTERAVAALRAYLNQNDLGHYRIYHCGHLDLSDIDDHIPALEGAGEWELPPPAVIGGEPLVALTRGTELARSWDVGFLRLPKHETVLARWYWVDEQTELRSMQLIAAPSPEHYFKLHTAVCERRHIRGASVWQIMRGEYGDTKRLPRTKSDIGPDLIISDAVRQRVETEIVGFFSPAVEKLYRSLKVPYRRGVLMLGPPGNGKTSLIRRIGSALAEIPAIILRPFANFDSDDLEEVIRRWTKQAPAILVLEDLDWLLKAVNVSTFLNLLDGIEAEVTGGLMLIATTNHPDALDPAVNNRPGRFDVLLEIPLPDRELRSRYFHLNLPGTCDETVARIAQISESLSFAHLEEILRLSGLRAIHAGRDAREDADLIGAAQSIRATNEDASRGHPPKPDVPFGLAAWKSK